MPCERSAINPARVSRTAPSDPDSPSTVALVESPTSASTPASPARRSAASSSGAPTSGSGSIFQSPVCMTRPNGVSMSSAFGSGIEWVSEMKVSAKGARSSRPESGTSVSGTSSSSPPSRSFSRSSAAAKGVA